MAALVWQQTQPSCSPMSSSTRENALLGAGAGIEVVGQDLVQRPWHAVVDDDLLAVKVRVAERRRDDR